MRIHRIKLLKEFIVPIIEGLKTFEVRIDDRHYEEGDRLLLLGWCNEKKEYTGDEIEQEVMFILKGGQFGIEQGYVVMSVVNKSVKAKLEFIKPKKHEQSTKN